MKKKEINYSYLSKKELEYLKDFYVEEKINSMSEKEIKKFVFENINHQIKDTIGDEEEMEAWNEMKQFFDDQFETTIEKIKTKFLEYSEPINNEKNEYEKRLEILETNKSDHEKVDMWDD